MRLFQTLLWIVFQCKSIQLPQCSVSNYGHGAFHLCLKFSCPFLSSRCNSCFFSSVLLTSLSPRSLQRASKDFKGSNMSCLRPFVHSLKISDLIHCLFHPLALLKHSWDYLTPYKISRVLCSHCNEFSVLIAMHQKCVWIKDNSWVLDKIDSVVIAPIPATWSELDWIGDTEAKKCVIRTWIYITRHDGIPWANFLGESQDWRWGGKEWH